MLLDQIVEGLDPAQREAVVLTRGPVAILAGAGTGKTTTITYRVAYQVASAEFRPGEILAVTFTDKAAGELRTRLKALGVEGVDARTFHSAALSQLSRLWTAHTGTPLGDLLDSKAMVIASLANALPPPHRFLPRRELASEIEWAKNRMVSPQRYLDELVSAEHTPPIPAELMLRVYQGYERRKAAMGRIDFEDALGMAALMFTEHPDAAEAVRSRYAAFTVDEYQDVNALQAALLDQWLGGRDELCVVGDDYQTIYSFTGASPSHLLGFRERFPNARLVKLETNYRSTQQVLDVANRLASRMSGFRKTLKATRPAGPTPVIRPVAGEEREVASVVEEAGRLHAREGIAYEDMAVLYRINARSEPFEEAFAAAGIPYQVRDGGFLRRPGPRAAFHRLRREQGPVAEAVERVTAGLGFDPGRAADGGLDAEGGSAEEVTRQADLARLRALAAEFASSRPDDDVATFLAELERRFSTEESGRGVNLMTFHRAKGLEFDAVFLPRLLDGEVPWRSGRARADVDEERRLLYVGITRARRHLFLTWPAGSRNARSPFVEELSPVGVGEPRAEPPPRPPSAAAGRSPARRPGAAGGGPLFDSLRRWRRERAAADGVPAYVVFHDATLAAIAERRPRSFADLRTVAGVGPAKLERYGPDVLEVVAEGM